MTVFCCQGDQGPTGPSGRPGDNSDLVSITGCTLFVIVRALTYTYILLTTECTW